MSTEVMLIWCWASNTWTWVTRHPAMAGSCFTFALILLGIVHSLFFFIPLDIPIFNLSSLSDFALPGVRQTTILLLVILFGIVLAVLLGLACRIILWILRINISVAVLLFQFSLLLAFGSVIIFFGILELAMELICKPLFYLYCRVRDHLSFENGARNGSILKTVSFINEDVLACMEKKLDDIEEWKREWMHKLAWESVYEYLSAKNGQVPFLLLSLVLASSLTAFKAWCESKYVKNYDLVSFPPSSSKHSDNKVTSEHENRISDIKMCLIRAIGPGYIRWVAQYSEVQIRYRAGDNTSQNLLLIGSTSDFVLFWGRNRDADNRNKGIPYVIPKTNIAQITTSQFGSLDNQDITEKPERIILRPDDNPWINLMLKEKKRAASESYITENALNQRIDKEMNCGEGSESLQSDLILFRHGQSHLDEEEKQKIARFANDYMARGAPKKTTLFSFTSPDGETDYNCHLALKRARAVRDEIPENFQGSITLTPIGEDHPINGIANSRSVVIAACRAAPGQVETADNPDTPPPSCPAPD